MQIILSVDNTAGVSDVQDWLYFNQIDHTHQTFWKPHLATYDLDFTIEDSVIIFNHDFLKYFIETPLLGIDHVDYLKKFLKQNNQLWFLGCDIAVAYLHHKMKNFIQCLDCEIEPSSVVLVLDAKPTERCYLSKLQNIRICVSSVNHFNRTTPRIQANTPHKSNAKSDFLLTTIQRRDRPHRRILWNQLNQRPQLLHRGLAKYHSDQDKSVLDWTGRRSHQHDWQDGHASMDLYSRCWLEIVPETCYRDLYYFTEKTQKPIQTQTPFLMVSTSGYLTWLQSQGFQTFGNLIDESYDLHYRMQDRVKHMLDVLEHIIQNGTESFYQASKPVLQHNFNRLCEISGSWQHEFDSMMWRILENAFDLRQ